MFVHNLQVVRFYRLREFLVTVGSRLLSVDCGYNYRGAWFNVLCACWPFSLCFGKIRLNMMWWEISRPPGPPNYAYLPPPVPILARVVVIAHQCTHPHPSAPICTHLHPLIYELYSNWILIMVLHISKCYHVLWWKKKQTHLYVDGPNHVSVASCACIHVT